MPPLRIVIEETEPGKFQVSGEEKPSPCAHSHPPEVPTGPCPPGTVKEESPSTSSEELAHAGRAASEMPTGIRIDSAKDVYSYHYEDFSKRTQEVFVVGCLSVSGELIGKPYEVALGQRAEVGVEVADIARPVIQTNASGFYALHFHPSGHAKPSKADIELTEMIAAHTKTNLPGVAFVDHVVIGCFASSDGSMAGEYCSIHETKKIYDGKTHEVIGTVRGYARGYSRGGPSQKAAQASAKAREEEFERYTSKNFPPSFRALGVYYSLVSAERNARKKGVKVIVHSPGDRFYPKESWAVGYLDPTSTA